MDFQNFFFIFLQSIAVRSIFSSLLKSLQWWFNMTMPTQCITNTINFTIHMHLQVPTNIRVILTIIYSMHASLSLLLNEHMYTQQYSRCVPFTYTRLLERSAINWFYLQLFILLESMVYYMSEGIRFFLKCGKRYDSLYWSVRLA